VAASVSHLFVLGEAWWSGLLLKRELDCLKAQVVPVLYTSGVHFECTDICSTSSVGFPDYSGVSWAS
jgi:hypothetical protein